MKIWLICGAIVVFIGWGELRDHRGYVRGVSETALKCSQADNNRKDEIIDASQDQTAARVEAEKTKSQIEEKADADIQGIRQVVDDCLNRYVPGGIAGRLFQG